MLDYCLTPEQEMIRDMARQIAQEKVAPLVSYYDEEAQFPKEIVQAIAQADLFGIFVPDAYGGTFGGMLATALVIEELSRQCAAVGITYAASALGSYPIILEGSEEQKKKYLPRVAKGEVLCAFALCEDAPSCGRITATARDNGFVLDGAIQRVINGPVAHLYSVFAHTNDRPAAHEISAFIVEKETPGLSLGKKYETTGVRAAAACDLVFKECFVPKENMVGKLYGGYVLASSVLARALLGIAAQAIGIAQGAMETCLKYSIERKQFNAPLCEFQALQFMMAKMAAQIEASRALTYAACRMAEGKEKDFAPYASMAKILASDTAMAVATDSVQILGGYGYIKEYSTEKRMRDAKVAQVYQCTNEIQKSAIARHLLKEYCKYDLNWGHTP